MSKLSCGKTSFAILLLCAAAAIAAGAQTFARVHSFHETDGANPYAGLVQATNGNLYGTASWGGANSYGAVFKISTSGTMTTLYSFCSQSNCVDGGFPAAGLVQGTDRNLYGTTFEGGANDSCQFSGTLGCGTVFKITPSGTLTTLYSFCSQGACKDGANPSSASLVEATNGNFYGTTYYGGSHGYGTVFKITPTGTLTTVHSFNGTNGANPQAGLIQATDGNFYGTTPFGGANNEGTVFEVTPSGMLTTLYTFCPQSGCPDGGNPRAALIEDIDGNFYGTTNIGGANGYGTVFKITSGGDFTALYSFCSQSGCADGAYPDAALVQATDGNFYGTTGGGGANVAGCLDLDCGTVFKITPGGTLTTLYSFCSQADCRDGEQPFAGLIQDTNGIFYGTTPLGGTSSACSYGCGTIFSLSVGLGPFVETQTTSGKVGAAVKILGTNLTGATSVTFNGTPAAFTVEGSSFIRATVPAGATTGTVQVVTPSGTLSSNVPFRVAP